MSVKPLVLIAVLVAHILVVWGGIGFFGDGWIMVLLCSASRIEVLSWILGLLWLASTASPILGLIALRRSKFVAPYLILVAITLLTIWLGDFMREIDLTYCDGP